MVSVYRTFIFVMTKLQQLYDIAYTFTYYREY